MDEFIIDQMNLGINVEEMVKRTMKAYDCSRMTVYRHLKKIKDFSGSGWS